MRKSSADDVQVVIRAANRVAAALEQEIATAMAFIRKVADQPDGRPTASRAMRLNDLIAEARLIAGPKKKARQHRSAGRA